MKVVLISIGKTNEKYLNEGISIYIKRLKHYTSFEMIDIPNLKKTSSLSKSFRTLDFKIYDHSAD